jgi:filamin
MATSRTWVDVQKKTFTGWANNFLKERIMKIVDISKDLEDGVLLINLLEIISGKSFVKYTKKPKGRFQMIENNNWVVKFIRDEGLKLVGIGAEDIVDGKLKLILGLIWTLILRYQIQSISAEDDGNTPKGALLEWVRKRIAPYHVPVNDFDRSWQDGKALAALTDSLKPGKIPLNSLSGDPEFDVNRAMDIAQSDFNIPKIMDPADLVNYPDELSIMTYVSYFRDYAVQMEQRDAESLKLEEERRRTRADPSKTTAEGPGLLGGLAQEAALFTVHAHNYYGEPLKIGGENFTILVKGEDDIVVEAAITDKKDGTYNVAYMPLSPQKYHIVVALDDVHIKNAPFNVTIEGANAANSNAFGPGLTVGHVNKPQNFQIQARDSKANPLKHGGDPFEVLVSVGGGAVPTEITDNGDGTYDVTYIPEGPGEHSVEIGLRGEPISGAPHKVIVYAATPENSYAVGPGLEKGQADHVATFKIHGVDVDGAPLQTGGDPFAVSVEGPHDVAVEPSITDNGDGTYDVSYTPTTPGDYKVSVFLIDKEIKAFPKHVHFKPTASPEKTEVHGPGLKDGQAEKPTTLKIIARDPQGHQRTDGGDNFAVHVDGPTHVTPQIHDNGDGTYDVTYKVDEPGDYKVNVTVDGKPIAHLPVDVHIRPAPSAAHSYAAGPGLNKGEVFDNEPAKFTIHAKDPKGNPLTAGGDTFKVDINGPVHVTPHIVDNNDGTYSVTYEPTEAGDYKIDITLDGHHIKDAPHHVTVKEGTDAGFSGFGSFTLTVVAKDKKGNPKTFGGDLFEVEITGPAEHLEVKAFDNDNGTYTAAYTLVGTGHYEVVVKLNHKHIEGSPFKQNVGSKKKDKANPAKKHTVTARAEKRVGEHH